MADDIARSAWSESANDLIVASYFNMLQLELAGQKFNKAARNRELQKLTGREHGSIERKHQNISAVMERLGLPWIKGYKPLRNFQKSLVEGVERFLATNGQSLVSYAEATPKQTGSAVLTIGAPPVLAPKGEKEPKSLQRLVRKFDPAERDARNRILGKRGEELVLKHEYARLVSGGRKDLARKLEWTSDKRGDGAGYDIHSFELDGADRLIEVKTTNGSARTPFYLSENERAFSEERPEAFKLLRLHDFRDKPAAFLLLPPLDQWVKLKPSVYRASF